MQDPERLTPDSKLITPRVAILWDESFLWGLMAFKALKSLALPFDLIKAEDIRSGILQNYRMLFVPGGWASNKSKALGEDGVKAIQDFVSRGGNYLGFCGGAGLATKAKGGIGLLDVKRMPTKQRVPSFSGRIELNLNGHPVWLETEHSKFKIQNSNTTSRITPDSQLIFHAWWPSQFIIEDDDINVLATYGDALPDAFSSDLNVESVQTCGGWDEFEDTYQINLNPERLRNEPAVLEGRYGKGKVVLSLIHFDTPDDVNGEQVLRNLWDYLGAEKEKDEVRNISDGKYRYDPVGAIHELPLRLCAELITLGERNFLWFWRNSMLLQWRRGVRGLEYNTLYIMTKEISEIMAGRGERPVAPSLEEVEALLSPFIEKAKRLLILERHALQKGHITYDRCDDPEIKKIRTELFSNSKSYGGLFKELIDKIDRVLFDLLVPNKADVKK